MGSLQAALLNLKRIENVGDFFFILEAAKIVFSESRNRFFGALEVHLVAEIVFVIHEEQSSKSEVGH